MNQWDRQEKPSDLHNAQQNYLALSRTCRQVHDEVRFFFYSVNSFSFNIVHQEKEEREDPALRCCNGSQILHCRISVRASVNLTEDFYKYKLVEAICECISKADRLRRLEIEYTPVLYYGHYQMFAVTGEKRELMKFTSLGLLAPIGRLVNVDDVAIEGDVTSRQNTKQIYSEEHKIFHRNGVCLTWATPFNAMSPHSAYFTVL